MPKQNTSKIAKDFITMLLPALFQKALFAVENNCVRLPLSVPIEKKEAG